MLQLDYLKFREGVRALEEYKAQYAALLEQLNEEIERLRRIMPEEHMREFEEIPERLKKADELYNGVMQLTNVAGLSLYQYQLAGKLTAYRCESVFISPIKGRIMRKIELRRLKSEMSGIQFDEGLN